MPTRKRNQAATMAKMFATLGVNVDGNQAVGMLVASTSPIPVSPQEAANNLKQALEMAQLRVQLEAESVLFYVEHRGAGFTDRTCKECNEVFASSIMPVAYCSDVCRAKSLAKIGVLFNPYGKTDMERWGGRIPKTPQAYIAAMEAVEREVEQEEKELKESEKAEEESMEFYDMLANIVNGEDED